MNKLYVLFVLVGMTSCPSMCASITTTASATEGTTVSPVTEVPEELTTIIEVEETEIGNNTDSLDFVNLPGYGVVDDANSTTNGSIFSCYNRRYGYYADIVKTCSMFHLCYPVQEQDTGNLIFQRFSFVCSDNSVFDQKHLVCADPESVTFPCEDSPKYEDEANTKLIESMHQNAQSYVQGQAGGVPQGEGVQTEGVETEKAEAPES